MLSSSSRFDVFFSYVSLQRAAVRGVAASRYRGVPWCRGVRRAALRLKFSNWPGVAVDDEGLLWLNVMMDFDVDETDSNF